MKCPKCGSDNTVKNGQTENGSPRIKCRDCGKRSTVNGTVKKVKNDVGMTLDEFREKYDVEYMLDRVLRDLSKNKVYEKHDILKLANLPISTPGASTILESRKAYYGKNHSKMIFSHPDTITMLKETAKLN